MNLPIKSLLVGTDRSDRSRESCSNRAVRSRCLLTLLHLAILLAACGRPHAPASTPEVVVVPAAAVPADPADPAWQDAPEHIAKLLPQDMVEPRLMTSSTAEVRVRALAAGSEVTFRLEWTDPSLDDTARPGQFVDACAVQLPRATAPDVPAPQMGEPGRPVEIVYWNAGWQAVVDGRGDTIQSVYTNAAIDHYPFQAATLEAGSEAQREMAQRYAPARALGNQMAGPRQTSVQDLVAEGPGTLTPAPATSSTGRGQRTPTGWCVVITRRLPADLRPPSRSQVALAIWQGAATEVGSRKMRTGWIPLVLEATR